jgi:drug/metabolite transporter (DMT)-like permease
MEHDVRLKGYAITVAGVLLFTPDALLIRLAGVEPFTYTAMRGLLVALVLAVTLRLRSGKSPWQLIRRMGWPGVWAALLNSLGGICFIFAFANTSVANVLVYVAAQPVLASIMTWLVIREPVHRSTVLAMLGTLVGIGIVVNHSLGTPSLLGDGAALMTALLFSGWFVVLRVHKTVDLVPSLVASGLLNTVLSLLLLLATGIGWSTFAALDGAAIGWTLLNCIFLIPFALALTTIGTRYLPTADVTLLMLIEMVLGPLWVWAVLDEVPATATLIGGLIILVSVAGHALFSLRRPSPR